MEYLYVRLDAHPGYAEKLTEELNRYAAAGWKVHTFTRLANAAFIGVLFER